MANTGTKGIDCRQTGTVLLFDAPLQSSLGALVVSGTTNLYLWEVQNDGTIKTYDFATNTFVTTTVTTEAQALTYRKSNNGATDTGYWSYALTTLTGFTVGANYRYRVNNSAASPTDKVRGFVYGSAEGDLLTVAVSTGVADLQSSYDFAQVLPTSPIASTVGESLFQMDLTAGRRGTAQAGSSTTITLDAGASSTNNKAYVGDFIKIMSGTGAGAGRTGVSYVASTRVLTVDRAWDTAPDNTSVFATFRVPSANVGVWAYGVTALDVNSNPLVALSATGLENVVIEIGVNARQALQGIGAATCGLVSGADTTGTVLIAGMNVSTTRIQCSGDIYGNRTVVTLTLS